MSCHGITATHSSRRVWCVATRPVFYPEDGELSIDNNLSARALRARAVGQNGLFVGSDNGGRTAAVLFSMTASCKRHGIDPFRYLADVLQQLPTAPADRLTELLPDVWVSKPNSGARKTGGLA